MLNENAIKFEELLRGDEALQAKLQELASSYDGVADDLQAVFDATVGKLAKEAGLPFTFEEGRASTIAQQDLNDEQLDALSGGGGWCWVVGGSDEPEAKCDYADFHFCAYVGLTWPDCT